MRSDNNYGRWTSALVLSFVPALLALSVFTGVGTAVAAPVINIENVVVGEGAGFAEFVVRLSAPSNSTVSVSYYTYSGSAGLGDYGQGGGPLVFTAGETLKTVRIGVKEDSLVESDESFDLKLNSPTNVILGTDRALATIVDNDRASGTPVIRVSDPVIDESAAEAVFVLSLDRSSTLTARVKYVTAQGTADSGDFMPVSGIASFAPRQTVATVRVPIINDAVVEVSEQFDLVLTSPSNATLPDPRGTATIGSNDRSRVTTPVINIENVVVGEGAGFAEFVVRLSAPSNSTVSVSYYTYTGSAGLGDYGQGGGPLAFTAGETLKTMRIVVKEDALVEGDEFFYIRLKSPTGATLGTGQVLATIVDND